VQACSRQVVKEHSAIADAKAVRPAWDAR
jgi:hypothetical protein